jgi:chemotaxis signal transduction protein
MIAPDKAADLRAAFDRSFAAPVRPAAEPEERLLAVRVAGEPFALRLDEIAAVACDRRIVPAPIAPRAVAEWLGLVGLRGELLPVYSLAALLGFPRDADGRRWIAVCAAAPVALALGHVEGQVRVARGALVAAARGEHVRQAARGDDGERAIVAMSSIVDAIARRCGAARAKER